MTLVFDTSNMVPRGQPGLHAFIVGVSAYPHLVQGLQGKTEKNLGLKPLSSAALTAFKIYEWLRENRPHMPVPLASCHLLLSPSEGERNKEPALVGLAADPTLENFTKQAELWRKKASSNRNNVALFYFAGHGVQRDHLDHVLLLQDFGAPGAGALLANAVDTLRLVNGMAPSPTFPQMALTQLYFIDACRMRPSVLQKYEQPMTVGTPWDVPILTSQTGDRTFSIFYTARPGRTSFGIKGDQTIFSKALLQCLNGGAAIPIEDDTGRSYWQVSIQSLAFAMGRHIDAINKVVKAKQECRSECPSSIVPLCHLDDPPPVDVSVEVHPDDAVALTKIKVFDQEGNPIRDLPPPLYPHPYPDCFPRGSYQLIAQIIPPTPGYRNRQRIVTPNPPADLWKIRVLDD